jgi:hypothetical protein
MANIVGHRHSALRTFRGGEFDGSMAVLMRLLGAQVVAIVF